jgi:hypothetical protein
MKNRLKIRTARILQLPTALLMLAVITSIASVGRADEISSMVITAPRPTHCVSLEARRDELLGNEMRMEARLAVLKTRLRVATDLDVKLGNPRPARRLAGNVPDHG